MAHLKNSYEPRQEQVDILFSKGDHPSCGVNLASCMVDTGFLFSRIKRPECKFDNSPPSNADVTNVCSYTHISALPTCLHGLDRGNVLHFVISYMNSWKKVGSA